MTSVAGMTVSRFEAVIAERGDSPFLEGFRLLDVTLPSGITIRTAIGGEGPPLLLLHGHPQTHVTWRKIAPKLAERFTVVATDLRGYGDSSKPEGGTNHVAYSKRSMAQDQVEVMRALGHGRFGLVGTTAALASHTA
jgi:haloacetate dehalogenase